MHTPSSAADHYELYYWPGIPGRGEFVRLVCEDAGVPYLDVARRPVEDGGGEQAVVRALESLPGLPAFAPPILRVGELVIAQTANICRFLGERHDLAPGTDGGRAEAMQLQLTVTDLVAEVHDTHHPIAVSQYYEDQKPAAKLRAAAFRTERLPKFLGYFERVLQRSGGPWLLGDACCHADLSVLQALLGLEYAFPRAFARASAATPKLLGLRDRVAARPRIAAYLASPRRQAFNEHGIFRHYPELDPA